MSNTDTATAEQHRHDQQRSRPRRAFARAVSVVGWGVPGDAVRRDYHIVATMLGIPLVKAVFSLLGSGSSSIGLLLTFPHGMVALGMIAASFEDRTLVPGWPEFAVMVYGAAAALGPVVVFGAGLLDVSVTAQGVRGFLCGLALVWVTAAALRGDGR